MITIAAYNVKPTEVPYIEQIEKQTNIKILQDPKPLTLEKIADLPEQIQSIMITPQKKLDKPMLHALKSKGIKVIATRSVGLDSIDMETAEKLGFIVKNVPVYSPIAMAEIVIYFIIEALRKLKTINENTMRANFIAQPIVGTQLNKRTVGILGYGHIGKVVEKLLEPFGCEIVIYTRSKPKNINPRYETNLQYFFQKIDILTIHCPLTAETEYLVSNKYLTLMPLGSIIINTARGKIVKTADILEQLNSGQLAFYATDVYETEAGIFGKEFDSIDEVKDKYFKQLVQHPNVRLTPHISYNTDTSLEEIIKQSTYNILENL
ncbi:MAG: NAD(P)-dependent oxidoreductase [Culicoidibacterales bacterium]